MGKAWALLPLTEQKSRVSKRHLPLTSTLVATSVRQLTSGLAPLQTALPLASLLSKEQISFPLNSPNWCHLTRFRLTRLPASSDAFLPVRLVKYETSVGAGSACLNGRGDGNERASNAAYLLFLMDKSHCLEG